MGEPTKLEQLDRELWRLPLRTPTLPPATRTCTYCLGRSRLVLVDPAPGDPGEQQRLLDWTQDRNVVALALTHHHHDHVGATAFLAQHLGVPVLAHALTAKRVPFAVQELLEDGEELPCDGPAWTAVFTPGHAPGHLAFFRAADRAVIAGDMVAGTGSILVDPEEGSMSQYLASLARLRALRPGELLPAHGPVLPDGVAALTQYIQHRQQRSQAVLSRLRAGDTTPEAMVEHVYTDVPVFMHALAARSVLSILLQHLEEGRALRTETGWAPG